MKTTRIELKRNGKTFFSYECEDNTVIKTVNAYFAGVKKRASCRS